MTQLTKAQIEAIRAGATPGPLGIRKSHMDDRDWEVYPKRPGMRPSIQGAQWSEIATVRTDSDKYPRRAKGNAKLYAASPDLARTAIALHDRVAELERAIREWDRAIGYAEGVNFTDDIEDPVARETITSVIERTTP